MLPLHYHEISKKWGPHTSVPFALHSIIAMKLFCYKKCLRTDKNLGSMYCL